MHQLKRAIPLRTSRSIFVRCLASGKANDGKSFGSHNPSKVPKSSASTAAEALPVPDSSSPSTKPYRSHRISMGEPLPNLPQPVYIEAEKSHFETQITELENGLKVGTQERYGNYCTIGVTIKTGARYEGCFPKGISHIVEKLGFQSTKQYATRNELAKELEFYGGIFDAQTSRDITVYAISMERAGISKILKLLADAVLRPQITEEELRNAKMSALYELEDMDLRPDQEGTLLEMVHAAAWKDNTLGFPRYCPPENMDSITRETILEYMMSNYIPKKMVVAASGVNHTEFVDLTKEYFDFNTTTWTLDTEKASKLSPDTKSLYTGGDLRLEKDFGQFNAGPMPVPKLAHMALGLESVSHWDPDFIPSCVLNIMMGGGGSFSAGGPGKGMYSRLYTHVLNLKPWVYNVTAYNNCYSDSGVFCIYGCAAPSYMENLTEVIISQLHGMATIMDKPEFERAKMQLKSMLLMNLETRPVVFEDIGRQILAQGFYRQPDEYMQMIDKVTQEDIARLATRMLKSKPVLVGLGSLYKLPAYENILSENGTLRQSQLRGRLNLFGR